MLQKVKEYLEKLDFETLDLDTDDVLKFIRTGESTVEEIIVAADTEGVDYSYEGQITLDDGQQIGFNVVEGVTSLDDLKRHMTAFRNLVKFYIQK